MSFGCGIGDIMAITQLALDVYRSCKQSAKEFQSISAEVSNLRVILEDLQEDLKKDGVKLSPRREERLCLLLTNAYNALHDLQQELMKYESLSTIRQKKYDAVRFGFQEVSDIRLRIVSTITSLNALEAMLARLENSQLRKVLVKYFKEVKETDLYEHSILSSSTAISITTNESWKDLQKELEDVGIDSSVLNEKKGFITEVLQEAIDEGIIDKSDVPTGVPTLTNATPAHSTADLRRWDTDATLIDEAYSQRVSRQKAAATQDPEAAAADLLTLHSKGGRNTSKKHSKLTSLALRALGLVSDERLIEAADEGDVSAIVKLIGRGANVKASDKWRWTALHMAAYGGFDIIAKLLIVHGADLSARTVDGETPLLLAERNGHKKVVEVIEEEVERRAMLEEAKGGGQGEQKVVIRTAEKKKDQPADEEDD